MAVIQADVLAVAPELGVIADANRFTAAIAFAQNWLDQTVIGSAPSAPGSAQSQYDMICTWVAAHRLSIQERNRSGGGGRGQVTATKAGDLSKNFAQPSDLEHVPPELRGTEYGIQAWSLIASCLTPIGL